MEVVEAGVEDLLRIVSDRVANPFRDRVERLIPADLNPLRIFTDPSLGVSPLERGRNPIWVSQAFKAGVTLGTCPAMVVGIGWISQDLVDHLVIVDVGEDSATVHADRA